MKLKPIEESSIFEDLKDPEFVAEYLEEMLREDDFPSFLIALRNVAKAQGGISALSDSTELGRESPFNTLSESGNPRFTTLQVILKRLGLRFSVSPDKPSKEAA